jgi:hypothetical protein
MYSVFFSFARTFAIANSTFMDIIGPICTRLFEMRLARVRRMSKTTTRAVDNPYLQMRLKLLQQIGNMYLDFEPRQMDTERKPLLSDPLSVCTPLSLLVTSVYEDGLRSIIAALNATWRHGADFIYNKFKRDDDTFVSSVEVYFRQQLTSAGSRLKMVSLLVSPTRARSHIPKPVGSVFHGRWRKCLCNTRFQRRWEWCFIS